MIITPKAFLTTNYHTLVLIQTVPKKKNYELFKTFCKNTNLKIVFSPFKLQDLFSSKDCLPVALKSFVVYKFTCAGCQSCYIGETKRHLPTRIKEHLQTDTKSHIIQHLNEYSNCRDLCDDSCFIIIDHASSSFRLKLKEVLHITWLKPELNKQKDHVSITISVKCRYFRLQHFRLFISFVLLIAIHSLFKYDFIL